MAGELSVSVEVKEEEEEEDDDDDGSFSLSILSSDSGFLPFPDLILESCAEQEQVFKKTRF